MAYSRSVIVKQAQSWIGKNEYDGSHKTIIDIYNAHKPLAVGYKVKYTDAWCAAFVSAVAIKCGYTAIIPTECGCGRYIDLFKKIGCWVESDSYVPKAGDIIFYDWDDNGYADNVGGSDHVGIVEKVSGNTITVIEGNYSNSVKRRTLTVNGKYIRGYGVPKYDNDGTATTAKKSEVIAVNVKMQLIYKGNPANCKGQVLTLQRILNELKDGNGYRDKDGNRLALDGDFGAKTDYAFREFQRVHGLKEDGECGQKSWNEILCAVS